jgi:uroporphyrinogen III methyltransferase/synthase
LPDDVPCYENVACPPHPERTQAILSSAPDLLVFTSSSTVERFVKMLGDAAFKLLRKAKVAALGPITANTLARHGKQVEICPAASTIPSLLEAIRLHYRMEARDKKRGWPERDSG